jgi:hypothetical protein
MSFIAKLNLKTVQRAMQKDPLIARRNKLLAGITEQKLLLDAMARGEQAQVKKNRWRKNEAGERVSVETTKLIRPWFFQQDNGWYVQCRYGSRILNISAKSNAVFVNKLDEVGGVLKAFEAAANGGELDGAITGAIADKLPTPIKARAKAN